MKRFFRLPTLLLLAGSLFLINACTTDETPDFVLPPTINLNAGTDLITGDETLAAGAPIKVQITAEKGDNDMESIEFQQDGVRIADFNPRITINGTTASSAEPLLFDTEKETLTWDIEILTDATEVSTYTIIAKDDAGNTDQVSLTITIEAAEPTLSFPGSGSTFVLDPGNKNGSKVTVVTNGSPLVNISVWQDGALIEEMDRVFYDTPSNEFASNPLPLEGDDVNGLIEKDVFIRTHDFVGTVEYTIQVENAAGKTANASYFVTIEPTGTPIDLEYTAVLLSNADGGSMILGGMDLYTGTNVSVNAASANIIDLGINGNPAATNWVQKISPANGAAMKELSSAQIDAGFSYAGVTFKEQIIEGWNGGVSVTEATNQVQVGDVFIVNVDNDYFILQCFEVNITDGNNEDNYRFDIKQALF